MKTRSLSKKIRSTRGALMFEAAIGITSLMLAMMFSMDMARIGWTWMTLNNSVQEAARWGSLGKVSPQEMTGTIKTHILSSLERRRIHVKDTVVDVKSASPGSADSAASGAGISGNYLIVEAKSLVDLMPLTKVLLGQSASSNGIWLTSVAQTMNE